MSRGFTLVEVVVALVVLEVGLLGAVGMLALASRTMADAERFEGGVSVAEGIADSLSAARAPVDGGRPLPAGGRVTWSVAGDGTFRVAVTMPQSHRTVVVTGRCAAPVGP